MIYFARLDSGSIKIGYSANPYVRQMSLKIEFGSKVEVLLTMEGGLSAEKEWRRSASGPAFASACYESEERAAKARDYFYRHYAANPDTLARYTEWRPSPSPIIPVGAWSYAVPTPEGE